MKTDNKKLIKYMLLCFLIAWLGYSLFFLFGLAYQQPGIWYLYGFILHIPAWIAVLLFGGLVVKLGIPRRLTFTLEVMLIAILLLPMVYEPSKSWYDYLLLVFYIVDYLLCLALLNKLRSRIIKS